MFFSMLLVPLSRAALRQLRLVVSPDTVLRWHRDLVKHRHSRLSVNRGLGRPRILASVRRLVLRLAVENPAWGCRRIHGELALLGIKVAPSTVWEILKAHGVGSAPQRTRVRWAEFRELLMDLPDAGHVGQVRFRIRDRDAKYPESIDEILRGAKLATVLTGVRMPRMNAIMERWVKTLRAELLDRTLIWNETRLRHVLREYEQHYNLHRTHRWLAAAAPLRARPQAMEPERIERLVIRRHDRLDGVFHEYRQVA